jgi:hypothetical protein
MPGRVGTCTGVGRISWPEVVERARAIVSEYEGGVTLRQVHYRLVAAGLIPNTPPAYRRLSARLAQARREGRFPALVDALREVHVPPAWPDAAAFLNEVPGWFRLDRTAGQEVALYVAAEKDTLRVMFTDWLTKFGIPVLVVRGFGSQSYVDVVRQRTARDPRPAVLAYVGDFDASGSGLDRAHPLLGTHRTGAAHPRSGPRLRFAAGGGQARRSTVAGVRRPARLRPGAAGAVGSRGGRPG